MLGLVQLQNATSILWEQSDNYRRSDSVNVHKDSLLTGEKAADQGPNTRLLCRGFPLRTILGGKVKHDHHEKQ